MGLRPERWTVQPKARNQRLTCTQGVHRNGGVRQRVRVSIFAQGFRFATWSVFVVGMLFHVLSTKTFGFVDERTLLVLGQQLPFGACNGRDDGDDGFKIRSNSSFNLVAN